MPEKKLRSTLMGILLWILLYVVAALAATKLDNENIDTFMLIVIPIITVVLAYIYMRSPKDQSVYEGSRLGFTWMVIMLTLDVIIRVYILENGWEYFRSWTVWIAFGEMVFLCALIGALMKPINNNKEISKEIKKAPEKKESTTEKGDSYFSK